ncbi:outer membrane beta-barrel protein [uncultured Tateyamaria sp.]|uniref:outer membrane protein n=1 Tax=uncultured Tateyamaria sp. TaxID=455651 RepID=UPI0026180653|nr:outer membrane beta-barrel protein [uncultured Tateyamaria sp.]
MKRNASSRAALLTAAAFCASAAASGAMAQDSGRYGFVYGGAVLNSDLNTTGIIGGNPQTVDTDYDDGFQFGLGVGLRLPQWSTDNVGVRVELDLSYSDTDADEIRFSGNGPNPEVNVSGGLQSTTLFANILADFDTGSAVTPFVGAGLGVGRFSQDLVYGPGVQVNESDTAFGAQLIAGVAWQVSDRVTLTADTRYRRFFDVESNRFAPSGASTGVVSGDVSAVSLNLGARIAF